MGKYPGEDWQIDFTHMPKHKELQYLLTRVGTFTRLVEGFPCRTEQAKEVVKSLVQEMTPRFNLPQGMQSDNGPAFRVAVTQGFSRTLGTEHRYCARRP